MRAILTNKSRQDAPSPRLYDWVKRLGQWHYIRGDEHTTICGMALLGNNYDKVIPVEEREKCPKCHGLGEERI